MRHSLGRYFLHVFLGTLDARIAALESGLTAFEIEAQLKEEAAAAAAAAADPEAAAAAAAAGTDAVASWKPARKSQP